LFQNLIFAKEPIILPRQFRNGETKFLFSKIPTGSSWQEKTWTISGAIFVIGKERHGRGPSRYSPGTGLSVLHKAVIAVQILIVLMRILSGITGITRTEISHHAGSLSRYKVMEWKILSN
jgi:hypothetical protein